MQQKSDSATIQRDTFETMLLTLVEQAEQIRELRATVGLQARQIEHLRDQVRSHTDHFGFWIERWPTK